MRKASREVTIDSQGTSVKSKWRVHVRTRFPGQVCPWSRRANVQWRLCRARIRAMRAWTLACLKHLRAVGAFALCLALACGPGPGPAPGPAGPGPGGPAAGGPGPGGPAPGGPAPPVAGAPMDPTQLARLAGSLGRMQSVAAQAGGAPLQSQQLKQELPALEALASSGAPFDKQLDLVIAILKESDGEISSEQTHQLLQAIRAVLSLLDTEQDPAAPPPGGPGPGGPGPGPRPGP